MKNSLYEKIIFIAVVAGSLILGAVGAAVAVETTFLYNLSNFNGPVPSNWANISVDEARSEIYVVDPRERDIRIFNDHGMEIYRFGDDGSLGTVADVAVKKGGGILVLSKRQSKPVIILCNFRGEPLSELELKNLPGEFSSFSPDHMVWRQKQFYLLDSMSMRIAVADANGIFQKGYDLAALLDVAEDKRGETEIGGLSVDRQGNMLFTVPVLFSAYRLSPDGNIAGFGRSGSSPGRFGIVGGIVSDGRGNYYVADRLKCVVLIFDKDFKFQTEFGYRGLSPENLIGPRYLGLDTKGRLYVSQLKSRGVSVFKINYH